MTERKPFPMNLPTDRVEIGVWYEHRLFFMVDADGNVLIDDDRCIPKYPCLVGEPPEGERPR